MRNIYKFYLSTLLLLGGFQAGYAQSTDQNNPTAVVSNEINGEIRARAIGDSRLTNYFYAFNANQGDVFVNIVTRNLDGDIDIFTIEGLKPLTKITLFADNSVSETGRVVYLRKFEKLLLRIQGRSPNDDAATFKIKFAGSFEALPFSAVELPKTPEIDTSNQGEFRVSSTGAILSRVEKPVKEEKVVAKVENDKKSTSDEGRDKEINVTSVTEKTKVESSAKIEIRRIEIEPIIEEPKDELDASKADAQSKNEPIDEMKSETSPEDTERTSEVEEKKVEVAAKVDEKSAETQPKTEIPETENAMRPVLPLKPEQLQNIELVVRFKDGKILKQQLNKVFSFNVNQGILTIVSDEGIVSRYSFLDIEKISIE